MPSTTSTTSTTVDDLRCSVITAALGEHPAGSAGGAHRYLLVELPLPWPKKIDGHPMLADVQTPTPGSTVSSTILGIRSDDAIAEDTTGAGATTLRSTHRIICYERTTPFRGFERSEFIVERLDLAEAVTSLLAGEADQLDADTRVDDGAAVEDLLLCTHGSRDRCCGQLGTLLHLELDCALPDHVRLWRTSHTGGHRFAPTGILFPAGTAWSSLTAELTIDIVNQTIATERLTHHFRGNVGVSGRPAQIAEGHRFLESGWDWLRQVRTVSSDALDDHGTPLHVASVQNGDEVVTFHMREDASLPVPICGEGTEHSVKSTPQLRITGVERRRNP